MGVDDVARIDLGTYLRPPEEIGTAGHRVEAVLGYVARTPDGVLLLATGPGKRTRRPRTGTGRGGSRSKTPCVWWGLTVDDIDLVVNCHLHFDHIG